MSRTSLCPHTSNSSPAVCTSTSPCVKCMFEQLLENQLGRNNIYNSNTLSPFKGGNFDTEIIKRSQQLTSTTRKLSRPFSRRLLDGVHTSTPPNKKQNCSHLSNDENIKSSFSSVKPPLVDPTIYSWPIYEDPYRLSPIDIDESYFTIGNYENSVRKISKQPIKVLDAPSLRDDFYLNLVDWSSTDVLAVGLGTAVYLLSACSTKITKLFDLKNRYNRALLNPELITSVNWDSNGCHLAIGLEYGSVEIWDVFAFKMVRTFQRHSMRVGTLAWNCNVLSTGSRDGKIYNRDIRQSTHSFSVWDAHKQEVCGLRWSPNERQLASGGNDNNIYIWQHGYDKPISCFSDHIAAVKALAWSPHQNGLLASGGGTADRSIRFWNTLNNQLLRKVDTGSQVCNIVWSKTANELVSTHGYSLNQIIVWNYPPMRRVATLIGHSFRVLYLAESPHGQTIVTGAGDETLRFWNVFPPKQPFISKGKQELQFQRKPIVR